MKHSPKIVALLLLMFFVTQLIGLMVANVYAVNNDNIPYGMSPPENINPASSLISIIIAIAVAVVLMLILMRFRIEIFLRLWFLFVIIIAIGISVNALFFSTNLPSMMLDFGIFSMSASSFTALVIALPLAFMKIFKRGIFVHNLTELLIYPGIAVIFVPLLSLWTVILLLILISVYDMYAVWHAGFMQKMAKYQIQNLKVFSGFLVPYLGKKENDMVKNMKSMSEKQFKRKAKKIKVNVAILGGGDVVFPIILAGVVLRTLGPISALIVALGATAALAFLFWISKKGRFYPAMPFISMGCFLALGLVYLLW